MTTLKLRIERFLARPWTEKREVVSYKVSRAWTSALHFPILKKVEPGFWFVVWNDAIRERILMGDFERAERKFVQAFLQPGMTFLDVGAYFGIYALTASLKVGENGRVIAFEPSPLQARRLRWHLLINRCKNVGVEQLALGYNEAKCDLFVPGDGAEGFSSLRSPEIRAPIRRIPVSVMPLDVYARRHYLEQIDFVKVDVEGGELDFFKGAAGTLSRSQRPVILCELQDARTATWGHRAIDAAAFLQGLGYKWFSLTEDGHPRPMPEEPDQYEGNFVGVPPERLGQIEDIAKNGSRATA